MRRLAAVFSSKRDSPKSTPSHTSPPQNGRLHLPLALAFSSSPQAPSPSSISSTPQLSSISDNGLSSDSSTRSPSVHAPAAEDDHHPASLSRNSTKRSWRNLFGGKRGSSDPPTLPEPPSKPPEPPRRPRTERPSSFQVLSRSIRRVGDSEKELLLEEEEYNDTVSLTHSDPAQPSTTKPSPVTSPAKAQQNLKLLIKNSLIPPSPSSPFVQPSPAYLFPVSCNRPQAVPSKVDMRRVVLKRRLLHRLERLSAGDAAVILPFGSKSALPATIPAPTRPDYEACFPPNTTLVFRASPGLRRWISRPCFEDRFSVFLPSDDGLRQLPVTSSLAVAALEYSESLDILADPDFDPTLAQPALSQDALYEPSLDSLPKTSPPLPEKAPPPTTVKSAHSFMLSPSPLRNQHSSNPVSSPVASVPTSDARLPVPPSDRRSSLSRSQSPLPTSTSPKTQPSLLGPAVKRAVRFAEDDAEDVEPLHILRQKKMREEKAKFLRAEKRRRLMQQEQERRRIEAERIEEENRRWAREKEKREMEQRQYAELVIAQRARRENQRAGIIPGLKMDENHVLLPSASSSSLRDTERHRSLDAKRSSLGPPFSAPRRGGSESSFAPSQASLFETSSHRGGSIGYSPNGSNSGLGYQSRPSSTYSSSSDGRRSGRQSVIPNTPGMPFMDRAASYPMWSASNQSVHKPTGVAPYPELMSDSLLLPPSAPFMMHQRPRQSRNSSPGRSHSSGSLNVNSASSSSERINTTHRQSSPRSPDAYLTSPGTSPGKSSHVRPGRSESRNSNASAPAPSRGSAHRTRPPNLPSPQLPRAQATQYTQSPNPWTALPTERGNLPTAMPVSPYSHSLGTAMNRGTNVSFKGPVTGQSIKKNHGIKR